MNQSFISGANEPDGVAVDGGHVYWANCGIGTIGRANLDGTGEPELHQRRGYPHGVAVDAG